MFKSKDEVQVFINELETFIGNICYMKLLSSQGLNEATEAMAAVLNKSREELESFLCERLGLSEETVDTSKTYECPECGGAMLLRTNRQNGDKFWGCKKYPACRGTRDSSGFSREERKAQQDSYEQQSGFSFKRSPATEVGPNKE